MGVMTFGLLGVAALFPVGGHYLRQGEISDRADAIAQSALNDAITRGMLDPENWLAYAHNGGLRNSDIFNRPIAEDLRGRLAFRSKEVARNSDQLWRQNQIVNDYVGAAFAIDPHGVAAAQNPASGVVDVSLAAFPASQFRVSLFQSRGSGPPGLVGAPSWFPWNGPFGTHWPLQRLTVVPHGSRKGNRPIAPSLLEAENMVMASDDLAQEFGEDADAPSQQRLFVQDSVPYIREARGDYSYMLTVVPTTPEARGALASDPASHYYDVSAVVFYKRVTGGAFDSSGGGTVNGNLPTLLGERAVRAAVASEGIGGGQLRLFGSTPLLENPAVTQVESPLKELKAGGWIMLMGPHPSSTNSRPYLFAQWYRVIAKEDIAGQPSDADVFVTGPDWPWPIQNLPAIGNQATPNTPVQHDLRAIIVPDVASVHTRTMKLQPGTQWNRRN